MISVSHPLPASASLPAQLPVPEFSYLLLGWLGASAGTQ